MKKILLLLLLVSMIVGCSDKDHDQFAAFRGHKAVDIYSKGEKALAEKNYDDAVKYFEALDALYPFGAYAQQGQLDIIYAYYMDNDIPSAIAASDRYVRLYPRGKHVDYAYYMRGVLGFSLGLSWLQKHVGVDPAPRDISSLQQSFSSFAILVQLYPNSPYAPDSLVRMAYIRNLMAKREVETAEFYMDRAAYVAAANRASYVVQHFNGSPQVAKALAIMVKAYTKLKLAKLAQSSYDVLQASYPNSREARRLKNA